MIDHDHVDMASNTMIGMVAADLDTHLADLWPHGQHPLIERDPRVRLVKRTRVRNVVHAADVHGEHALRRDDCDLTTDLLDERSGGWPECAWDSCNDAKFCD